MPSRKEVESLVSLSMPAICDLIEEEALNIARKSVALFPIDSCEGDDQETCRERARQLNPLNQRAPPQHDM